MIEQIDKSNVPKHVAVIMDGNGRWAKKRGLSRIFGHRNGVKAVKETVEAAGEIGVKYLTLYAFSTENWERPTEEIEGLMALLIDAIVKETPELDKNNVQLKAIGDLDSFPQNVRERLNQSCEFTSKNTGLTLTLALSYSSRWEILQAVNKIAIQINKNELKPEEITAQIFEQHLATAGMPDPELLIRTSGELRISNFLLWQAAYSELYFPSILWPDFRKEDFRNAIIEYQKRERRFGKTEDQLRKSNEIS
ncbi:MAG: isoprenyl transferase [Prevotellaceae bacterium]|jgi:undecaprenyl diphosphate synthase|nr:isoprenyl transferase [Prevotellaceae bacterium]